MRNLLPIAVLLAACGDISNGPIDELVREDVEFAMALPSADDVAMDGPDDASATQGLKAQVDGLTRRICEAKDTPEDIFCGGHVQAAFINALTRGLLAIVDSVRSLPPTRRADGARTWGPYPDDKHPGRTWEAHVHRAPAGTCVARVLVDDGAGGTPRSPDGRYVYRWEIDVRVDGGEKLPVLSGCYRPGKGGTASGVGRMIWDGKISREKLQDPGAGEMNRLTIDYDLLSDDRRILATFIGANPDGSDGQELRFGSRRATDGSGGWGYLLRLDIDHRGAVDELAVRARWTPRHAGRADARVTLGDPPHAQFFVRECWDALLDRVYFEMPDFGQCPEGTTSGGGTCTAGFPRLCAFSDALF